MASMDPAELEAVMAATGAFMEEFTTSGVFVFAGGLHPQSSAVTVDGPDGDPTVQPGPVSRALEYLGGCG